MRRAVADLDERRGDVELAIASSVASLARWGALEVWSAGATTAWDDSWLRRAVFSRDRCSNDRKARSAVTQDGYQRGTYFEGCCTWEGSGQRRCAPSSWLGAGN